MFHRKQMKTDSDPELWRKAEVRGSRIGKEGVKIKIQAPWLLLGILLELRTQEIHPGL